MWRWYHRRVNMALLRFCLTLALVLLVTAPTAGQKPDLSLLETTFARIAKRARGKIGVALIHLESGAILDIRGHERFPMASVVKLPIAIEVLTQVAERRLRLDQVVLLGPSDIRPCCSLERRHPNGGVSRTVVELLELAMIESDNTAADALLKLVGGPEVVERRLATMGFQTIRVDRSEGQLLLDMAGVLAAPPPELWTVELQRRLVAEVDPASLNIGRVRYLADERDTATPYRDGAAPRPSAVGRPSPACRNRIAAESHDSVEDGAAPTQGAPSNRNRCRP